MQLRECRQADLPALIDLTIEAFRPLFEADLPKVLDPRVFAHDHGNWKEKYREEVPALHDPDSNRFITVAEDCDRPLGYVGWQVNPDGSGRLHMVAVHPQARRQGVGSAVCRAALTQLKERGVTWFTSARGATRFMLRLADFTNRSASAGTPSWTTPEQSKRGL